MGKELSEMSLEELWALFPIILCEHTDEWKGGIVMKKSVFENY